MDGFKLSLKSFELVNQGLTSYSSLMTSKPFASIDDDSVLQKTMISLSGASSRVLQAKRREAQAAKAQLENWKRDCEAKCSPLRDELQACSRKLDMLQTAREDLARRLREIDVEIAGTLSRKSMQKNKSQYIAHKL